ncbi:hypothetical protein ACFW04_014763 [Cataglyphis niger]
MYKHKQTDTFLSDDDIISKYREAFKALIKRLADTLRHICISCEKLSRIDIQIWKDLMAHIQQQKINAEYICNYCAGKFRKGLMPAYCIINNLFTDDVPEVISFLNTFEKILIQTVTSFQTIFKMGTIKHNNALYSFIILPSNHDLCLANLKNLEFQIEETEHNIESTLDSEPQSLNDLMEEIKNDKEVTLENQQKTIEVTLENQQKAILNQQYLFYLLNDANIRQLSRGIFHKINVTNSRVCYTAAEYLEAVSKELLESNMSTIFTTLQNTKQYWRKPKSNLNCMTQHYGLATFLTLSSSEWLWEDLGEYIREDPVSRSRFFDNKFRAMLDFISSKDYPIGEVTHHFWRRENQGRDIQPYKLQNAGSKYFTILLYKHVNMHQRHKHNDYCVCSKKVGRKVICRCRFGFPHPVTETLNMRDVATSIAGRKQLKHKININDYNPVLLTAWEDNMYIQFIEDLRNKCDTYVESFHKVKLHLVEALQYHERLEELQKTFETAKELVQQCLDDNLQKQQLVKQCKILKILIKMVRKIDVSKMIAKLNTDQKQVFNRVINTVNSDDKSIKIIHTLLDTRNGSPAPTGIATFNIDGLTVHRLFQLPVEHDHIPKYEQLSDHVLKVLREDLKDVVFFVIDKMSMISNLIIIYMYIYIYIYIFDCLKYLTLMIVMIGLVKSTFFYSQTCFNYLLAVNLWTTLFDYGELKINMRQHGDDSYRELLSRIRIEKYLSKEILSNLLNELCNFINNLSLNIVCLLSTCRMCDVLNDAMLSRIVFKEILLIAEDMIECIPYVKKKVLKVLSNNDDDNNSRTAEFSKRITIKIGTKVMIRRNIDVSLGLVNGTIEKIKFLLPSDSEYLIERVSVKFEVINRAYIIRKQFPLSLCYGITIHKSQGLSLQNVIMDIGNSVFNYGQVYVALSRVTSLEGLHLINYDLSSIIAIEIITVSKERYCKVKDVLWALPKVITSVQKSHEKVSCYANAVLQCLLHLNLIKQQLFNCNKSDVLCILLLKATNKFNLCAVPTTKVLIAGQLYKTMNAIFQHDLCIDESHYISKYREGISNVGSKLMMHKLKKAPYKRIYHYVSAISYTVIFYFIHELQKNIYMNRQ